MDLVCFIAVLVKVPGVCSGQCKTIARPVPARRIRSFRSGSGIAERDTALALINGEKLSLVEPDSLSAVQPFG